MNGFGVMSLLLLVAAAACQVYGQVPSSTPCSLSVYRYLYNLPGEQIRPNLPEGTYIFGKRIGPPLREEGQASNIRPAILKPEPSYEAPQYLPPPVTTTTTTTTRKPSTSAPIYIPPPPSPSPYYPAEASNTISVVEPVKPVCKHPGHQHEIDTGLVPPYRFVDPAPQFQQPQPQPTYVVPKFVPVPVQKPVTPFIKQYVSSSTPTQQFVNRYPAPTPPPQFIRQYVQPAPVPEHKDCDKHRPVPTSTTTTTQAPTTTTPEPVVETRQNEIFILPQPQPKPAADCVHKQHNVQIVVPEQGPSASAGYSYDAPSQPLAYPSATFTGYAYPKGSPSFEYPSQYPSVGQAIIDPETLQKSSGTEDHRGDLVILKV